MNELGLTRESVRQTMEQIVKETIERHMTTLEESGQLDRIIEGAFERKYKDPKMGYGNFQSLVTDAARAAAHKFVVENVSISLKDKV